MGSIHTKKHYPKMICLKVIQWSPFCQENASRGTNRVKSNFICYFCYLGYSDDQNQRVKICCPTNPYLDPPPKKKFPLYEKNQLHANAMCDPSFDSF